MTENEWLDLIDAEPLTPGAYNCPGCGGEPCVWLYHLYPQPAGQTTEGNTDT